MTVTSQQLVREGAVGRATLISLCSALCSPSRRPNKVNPVKRRTRDIVLGSASWSSELHGKWWSIHLKWQMVNPMHISPPWNPRFKIYIRVVSVPVTSMGHQIIDESILYGQYYMVDTIWSINVWSLAREHVLFIFICKCVGFGSSVFFLKYPKNVHSITRKDIFQTPLVPQ